jgi:hypothetical protein
MGEDFEQWLLLADLSISKLTGKRGECPAVYALRNGETGETLKFGHTGCLRTRIFGNYLAGFGGGTTQRIHKQLLYDNMIDCVEVSWIVTADSVEAEHREKQFRKAYKATHGKRPIWDLTD